MALSATIPLAKFSSQMVKQTALSTTPDNNVIGGSCKIFMLDCTNGSSSAKGFVKLYDQAADVVFGTDHPFLVFPLAASQRQVVTIAEGHATANGISWAFSDAGGSGAGSAVVGGTLAIIAVVRT